MFNPTPESKRKQYAQNISIRNIMLDAFTPKLVNMVFCRYIPPTIQGEFGQERDYLVGNIR
jgi:hypothetical protein